METINVNRIETTTVSNTMRESFETALRDADSKRRLPKCYYSTFDQDRKFTDILFEEYKQTECIASLNTIRTLLAVELLQDMFTIDYKAPERSAKAISKLLSTVDPYIKDSVISDIAKDNYTNLEEQRGTCNDWVGAKVRYNIELLLS